MPLPGLKPSIELDTTVGPQLVNRDTGQTLALSDTETQLLGLWDGQLGATALSAKVFVEGLDVEPWQVEQFFARLARAGLLEKSAPVVPDFVPSSPGVEAEHDIVPRLRGDLIIAPSKGSRGTLEVKDPLTQRTFTLYDFEVSIARMLDGRRTAADVLAAANRLGIPVTLPTLKTFLQQLRAYQFIDASKQGGESTWPRRRQWEPGVRELYQSALRLLRAGKYDEARGYADAIVEADPHNEEAAALRARIEAEARGSFELSVPFDTLHTPLSTDAVELPAPALTDPELPAPSAPFTEPEVPAPSDPFASFGFNAQPPPAEALPPLPEELIAPRPSPAHAPPPAAPEPHTEVLEHTTPPPNRRPLFLVIGAVLGVTLVLFLFRPVQVQQQLTAELRPTELGVPAAPLAGAVRQVLISTAAEVEKGAVLARLTPEGQESPEVLAARIKKVEARLLAVGPPATGIDVVRARAALKAAERALAPLLKQKAKASKAKLLALERKIKPKQRAVDAARAKLESLTGEGARAELGAELEELTAKKVAADVQQERATITAPEAGLFLPPEPAPAKVAQGDAWGRVVAPRYQVITKDPLPSGATRAVFESGAGTLEAQLQDGVATVAGEAKWAGARGTLTVSGGRRPWLLSR